MSQELTEREFEDGHPEACVPGEGCRLRWAQLKWMPFVPQGKLELESNMKSRKRGAADEINEVFWTCLEHRDRSLEKWMSAPQIARPALPRYHKAAFLQDVRLDA